MSPLTPLTTSTSSSALAMEATTAVTNTSGEVDVVMVSLIMLALLVLVGAVTLVMWGLCRRVRNFRTRTVDVPSPARRYPPSHLPAQFTFKADNLLVSSLAKPTSVQPPIYKPSSGYEKLLDPNGAV